MKLTRILIEDFKQFTGRVVIDDLNPGLNIFTGPNEAGKTSIATAVRTIFLEKHRSSTLKHLVPWQTSSGQPRIEVEFTTAQQHFLLRKSFVNKARCELIKDGRQRLEGEEAEEALSALLRFARPSRGSAAPEHGGIPGLLWVMQGQAQDVDGPVGHAAVYLREALNQLSGATVESGEDVLISAVKQELHKLLTEKTRKPTGVLASIEAELEAALEEERHLRGQQAQYEEEVDRLVRLQAEYDDVARRKPWEILEKKAKDAESKVTELRAAKNALEQIKAMQSAGREQIRLLREREQDAGRELDVLASLEAGHLKAKREAEEATAQLHGLEQNVEAAAFAVEKAQQRLQLAQSAQQAHDLRTQAEMQQAEVERIAKALANAQGVSAQIKAVSAQADETEIDEAKLRKLRALDNELSGLQAKIEAAGTRIEYRLEAGKQLTLNGEPLQGNGNKLLEAKSILGIPQFGEVVILLGASNISALSGQQAAGKSEQAALLPALGVRSLPEAEQRLAAHQDHKRELENLRKLLKVHAPDGVDALESALATARSRHEATLARLNAIPDPAAAPPLQEAKEQANEARARHAAGQDRHRELFGNRSSLEARASSLLEQLEARRRLVQGEEWQARQKKRQADLVDALAKESVLAEQLETAKRRLEELQAEVNEGDVERFSTSARLQREAHGKQKNELIGLGAKLEQLGASGVGERLAETAALVEQLKRRKDELELRANALAMLTDVLIEERDKTVQRLQAPLLGRLDYYLRKLFPQAELSLHDNLAPAAFSRDGWGADLKQLSFGTQEQLGILCRLAYADLLRDAQVPTLLILDDAVVHTDSARRDRIKRALLDAVERHQILVFTCHPEAWDDLGIIPRNIQSMRYQYQGTEVGHQVSE
jgi:DNA repair exonuclease SbcCD ATPase subunit